MGFWGFTTMILMNRAASGSFTDISPLTTRPFKAVTFFLMGASLCAFVNIIRFRDLGYQRQQYQIQRRVAQNEHTHVVLKTLKQELDTRKMGVWDAVPQ